ncbi:MAG: threonine ammonia-lyase, biosynthetic [Candidatus Devosia symbiotica]|nr:threonine ammonia-lyase, biosynthetic [Candidatus Devosia symbiotica]
MQNYVRHIPTSSVYEVVAETPLDTMALMSARLGADVLLKREDMQLVLSFKIRGAHNRIAQLSAAERARGVICASAGNHAQGVALSANRLGIRAIVAMSATTLAIKINAVRKRGGEVVLYGDGFDAAHGHAAHLAEKHGYVVVHPFDDADVIAGQGTIGMKLLRQHPSPIGAIYMPIDSGGLEAGIAAFVKFLRPKIRIIGVESQEAASMQAAIAVGHPVALDQAGLFADGVTVRQVSDETFRICCELLDDIITVSADEICAAIEDIFDDHQAIAELAGALALVGLCRQVERGDAPVGALIAINSGANINFNRLRYVAEWAEIGERAEALLAVDIPERPGSYRTFMRLLGPRSITEFNYRFVHGASAKIFVGVKLTGGEAEKHEVIALLQSQKLTVIDLADNEVAKLHLRHMVGGRINGLRDEVVYRFQFPERPGADAWNISLFHYRNHGADYGRVLVGVQVPAETHADFIAHIDAAGFPYWEETDNPAYRHLYRGKPSLS